MSIDQDLRRGPVAAPGDVEPAGLEGEELAAHVRACWSAQNRATSRLLEALHHLGRAEAGRTARRPGLDEFSGDEIAALLGWSRTTAARKLDLADDLIQRLPEVGEALHEGWIDEPKARTICELTRDLGDDHARLVCGVVLPEAPELAVGALAERIEAVAPSFDPDWAERRRRRAESRARVILSPNPSGTATLSFCDAPTPDGINSRARIDALAAAIRHLGVLVPIGALRLQVGMRLLDGSTAGMDDRTIALLLAAEYHAEQNPPGPDAGPEDGPAGGPDPDDGPDDHGPDDHGPDGRGPDGRGPDDHGPDDHGPDDHGPDGRGPDEGPDGGDPAHPEPDQDSGQGVLDLRDLPEPPDPPETADPPAAADPPTAPVPLDVPDPRPHRLREGIVELRLRLSTALGLDQHPGSVPGYGAVLAHDARALLAQRPDGEWRLVLTDDDGRLQHVLLARHRPRPPRPRPSRPRDPTRHRPRGRSAAIVELQAPTSLLAALDPAGHGEWTPLLTELQGRLAELGAPGAPPDADAGPDQWLRRRPGAELDRWIRVRDRHCVAPGCRRPAHQAELDHTRDHARGGPTSSPNLGAWCTHHHRAKHHADWHVRQPTPGRFVIRTRAGITHTTEPRRVIDPLPPPHPAASPRPLPHDGWSQVDEDIDPDWYRKVAPRAAAAAGARAQQAAAEPVPPPTSDPGEPPF